MRLFAAIDFDDDFKRRLLNVTDNLKPHMLRGRLTRRENLHLTLVFLGEIDRARLKELTCRLSKVSASEFTLTTGKLGHFRQREGDLYWLGLQKSEELMKLNSEIMTALTGFTDNIDGRFSPHLTLGRGMEMDTAFDEKKFEIAPFSANIREFCLMSSDLIGGKRVYTPINKYPLPQVGIPKG